MLKVIPTQYRRAETRHTYAALFVSPLLRQHRPPQTEIAFMPTKIVAGQRVFSASTLPLLEGGPGVWAQLRVKATADWLCGVPVKGVHANATT